MSIEIRQILRASQVDKIAGINKSTRVRLEARGKFPSSVKLGLRPIGYYADEIQTWVNTRPRVTRTDSTLSGSVGKPMP